MPLSRLAESIVSGKPVNLLANDYDLVEFDVSGVRQRMDTLVLPDGNVRRIKVRYRYAPVTNGTPFPGYVDRDIAESVLFKMEKWSGGIREWHTYHLDLDEPFDAKFIRCDAEFGLVEGYTYDDGDGETEFIRAGQTDVVKASITREWWFCYGDPVDVDDFAEEIKEKGLDPTNRKEVTEYLAHVTKKPNGKNYKRKNHKR